MPDVLITGATGFVGGQLLTRLRDRDVSIRLVVRDASRLTDTGNALVVEGDLDDDATVRDALRDITTAYYLVHSMEPGSSDFAGRDRELAERFVAIAGEQGVRRIVYLGGIDPLGEPSAHLESRHEIEEVLQSGKPEVVVLRASMIVGARSDSFATLAQIVARLPVLALPDWRSTCTQPVAIADVVDALAAARYGGDVPAAVYDIAGADKLSIEEMCDQIADLLGERRRKVRLPFSSSKLEAAAAALVTDSEREVLEPLLEGLKEDLVVTENALPRVFAIEPTPFRVAARDAIEEMSIDR